MQASKCKLAWGVNKCTSGGSWYLAQNSNLHEKEDDFVMVRAPSQKPHRRYGIAKKCFSTTYISFQV